MTAPQKLLKAWNLRARKALGQNFLKEPSLAESIVALARLGEDDVVLEIGAGLGAMTVAAARQARKVIAVEKDRQLIPLLRAELLVHDLNRAEICQGDILALNLSQVAADEGRPLVVMGNLPYNISSQVLVKLIKERQAVQRAVLMFQKELADRLCADPGSKTYGRLSVLLQYCAELTVLREIKADMFFPRPKVGSVLLGIDFKGAISPRVKDEALFASVIQAAFGQRRKTLRNALSGGLLPLDKKDAVHMLETSGIDPRRRAETLTVDEFVTLTNTVAEYLDSLTPDT